MTEVTKYIADDGTEFDDEYDCLEYEFEQNVKGGKSLVTGSYMLRIVLMFVVLFACAKSGHFHVIALVLPLVFVRPILTVAEFFQKKGSDM